MPGHHNLSVWESSHVVGFLRRVCRGSRVCGALMRLGRSLSGQSSWIGTRLARHPPSRDFPNAVRVLTSSAVFGTIERFFVVTARAWQASAAKHAFDRSVAPLDTAQRVRLIGWIVFVAAITHAGLGFSTLRESWRARLVWALMLAIGATMVAACRPVAAAWRNWRRPSDPPA